MTSAQVGSRRNWISWNNQEMILSLAQEKITDRKLGFFTQDN